MRGYLDKIGGFKKITIIKREKNWGLADSIIDGVTKIVNEYGKIIVLEDDLVTSPYFLKFMNDALEFYKNDERVMHITGYVYPIDNTGLYDTYFIKPASCWGWATWDNSWKYFKKDIDYYLKVFDKKMRYDFNLSNSYPFFKQLKQNKTGQINTWAIFWYASVYLNNGISLHPKDSFIQNIGFDEFGTHCKTTSVYYVDLIKHYPVKFTETIQEDIKARRRFEYYFRSLKIKFWKRVINKINRLLK